MVAWCARVMKLLPAATCAAFAALVGASASDVDAALSRAAAPVAVSQNVQVPTPQLAARWISAGNDATCGVRSDGRLHCWGVASGPNEDLSSFTAVSTA